MFETPERLLMFRWVSKDIEVRASHVCLSSSNIILPFDFV